MPKLFPHPFLRPFRSPLTGTHLCKKESSTMGDPRPVAIAVRYCKP